MIETSLGALGAAFRSGADDPVRAFERCAAAAERAGVPGGIRCVLPEAEAAAEASRRRFERGQPLGPLDGVPIAVKDCIDVAGVASFAGTRFLDAPARADATVVARLKAAGAVIFAKTEMHELGVLPTGVNSVRGTPVNPWAPDRIPGGSSSGSAVAVATGLAAGALGTDAGGSLRVPASLCGIVALKPTFGAIPMDGILALTSDLDHVGPMAWTVADVAAMFEALAQRTLEPGAKAGRVAVLADFFEGCAPGVAATAREAIRAAFGEVPEVRTPATRWAFQVQLIVAGFAMVKVLEPVLTGDRASRLGDDTRALVQVAAGMPRAELAKGELARRAIRAELAALLSSHDVLVAPAVGSEAPLLSAAAARGGELDLAAMGKLAAVAFPGNLTGLPCCAVPCAKSGAPVGLQILGRPGDEGTVLAAARGVESVCGPRKPPLWRA